MVREKLLCTLGTEVRAFHKLFERQAQLQRHLRDLILFNWSGSEILPCAILFIPLSWGVDLQEWELGRQAGVEQGLAATAHEPDPAHFSFLHNQ